MKCKDKQCKCGQDLTGIEVVEPAMWTIVDGKRVPYTECPRCLGYCFLVEPKAEKAKAEKKSEPKAS